MSNRTANKFTYIPFHLKQRRRTQHYNCFVPRAILICIVCKTECRSSNDFNVTFSVFTMLNPLISSVQIFIFFYNFRSFLRFIRKCLQRDNIIWGQKLKFKNRFDVTALVSDCHSKLFIKNKPLNKKKNFTINLKQPVDSKRKIWVALDW